MPNTSGVADHGTPPAPFVARARKFLVGAAGLAAQVVTSGALDDANDAGLRLWVQAALAVATAAGIYQVKNAR